MWNSTREPEALAAEWIQACNTRDIMGLLALCDVGIEFHPLRIPGVRETYRGHLGIREWIDDLARNERHHTIRLASVTRQASPRRVLVTGRLLRGDERAEPGFSGLYQFDRGLILTARHFFTSTEALGHGGLAAQD